jgi:hypothetical protein
MSRPLRSSPITGDSALLRAGPPADSASVLRAPRFLPPGALPLDALPSAAYERRAAGTIIGTRLPTFHAEAAEQDRAAFMPDTAWPVNGIPARLIPGSHW